MLGCLGLVFQSLHARPVDQVKPVAPPPPKVYEASSTGIMQRQSVPDAGATALLLGGVMSLLAVARYSKR